MDTSMAMRPKTFPSNKLESDNVSSFTTFAMSQPQEQSRLLMLPREMRDKILNEVLVDDPLQKPDLSLAFACKQLYNEATSKISRDFAVVDALLLNYDKLGDVLGQKVKTAIQDAGDKYEPISEKRCMLLLIAPRPTEPDDLNTADDRMHRFLLIGLANLHAFVKAIVLARSSDLPDDADFKPDVRKLVYELCLRYLKSKPCNNAHEKLKRTLRSTLREKQLLQPFFEFFWSGFKDVSINYAVNDKLARKLTAHVAKDKWKTPREFITFLDLARETGKAAYLKGDLISAHLIWQGALDVKDMTIIAPGGYMFMLQRFGNVMGRMFDEVIFHLLSNLAAVLLKFAEQPHKTHEVKMELAAKAHQACINAIEYGEALNFFPSKQQIGKIHYRRAQALRMRSYLPGNLKEAEIALSKAKRLCPKDAALLNAEKKELELACSRERAKGEFKTS